MIGLCQTYFDKVTKIGGGVAIKDIKKGTLVSPEGEIMIIFCFILSIVKISNTVFEFNF